MTSTSINIVRVVYKMDYIISILSISIGKTVETVTMCDVYKGA